MPPRDSSEPASPAIASISAPTLSTTGINFASGAGHGGNTRGETVVVAVADFIGRNRVVLVDHGHGAPFQQLGNGRTCVEIAPPLLGILQCHENLAGADAVRAQHFRPDPRQRDLAHGGSGLALFQLQRAARQFQPGSSERDRTRRDDQHVAALAMEFREIRGERRQPRRAHFARFLVDQKRGADLDDDTPEILELGAGHVVQARMWFEHEWGSSEMAFPESNTRHVQTLEAARIRQTSGKLMVNQPITKALSLLPSGSRK
jgi:hypothetical protein